MFPESFIESANTENTTEEVGVDFVFDYKTGQHIMKNGLLAECTAIQSIQQFIQNVFRTKVKAYKVYTEGETETFGISVYDYLGQRTLPVGYVNSELKREVTQQLLNHPLINSVSNRQGERKSHCCSTVKLYTWESVSQSVAVRYLAVSMMISINFFYAICQNFINCKKSLDTFRGGV